MKQRMIIIGGMGPQASLELHQRINSASISKRRKRRHGFSVHRSLVAAGS